MNYVLQIIGGYVKPAYDQVDFSWLSAVEEQFRVERVVQQTYVRSTMAVSFDRSALAAPFTRLDVEPFELASRKVTFSLEVAREFARAAMTRNFIWEKTDGS